MIGVRGATIDPGVKPAMLEVAGTVGTVICGSIVSGTETIVTADVESGLGTVVTVVLGALIILTDNAYCGSVINITTARFANT